MNKVSDILNRKGSHVYSVEPNTPVIKALQMMADHNIGSVVVMEDGIFRGIVSERDYSRKIILKQRSSETTSVSEIMSTAFPPINPNDTVDYCMQELSQKNLRYLPVFREEKICGIISINDLVKETILSQQETISSLQEYLHAT